jgi:hypothetical protein
MQIFSLRRFLALLEAEENTEKQRKRADLRGVGSFLGKTTEETLQ